jgi:hypothetical protein
LSDDNETDESKFYPLYDKILNHLFPPSEGFDIWLQWEIPGASKSVDFAVMFPIENHRRPLLLVEVRPPSDFPFISGRRLAIAEVLRHVDEVGPKNQHADRLYAISAIGKKWRACYTPKGKDSTDGQVVNGVGAVTSLESNDAECWNPDITSDDSWVALQSIVETVKGYVSK